MSAAHTPGPWSVFDGREVDGISPWVVTKSGDPEDSDGLYVAGLADNDAETIANARLIAAAPDLLEALQAMKRAGLREGGSASEQSGLDLIYEKACAAIAKAVSQ